MKNKENIKIYLTEHIISSHIYKDKVKTPLRRYSIYEKE